MSNDNSDLPPNDGSTASLNPDEFDFLMQYWEMRTPAEVISWAVNLAVELTKAQSKGWGMGLHRGHRNDKGALVIDESHYLPLEVTLADEKGRAASLVNDDGTLNIEYVKEE